MKSLDSLVENIDSETADQIIDLMYGTNQTIKEDLFNLYNQNPQSYSKIQSAIYGFVSANCNAKIKNDIYGDVPGSIDPLYIFGLNALFHRALFTNILAFKENIENINKFFIEKKEFLIMIANHPNLSSICEASGISKNDVKYMIYQNLRMFSIVKSDNIPNFIPDDKELYALELIDFGHEQSYERLSKSYLTLRSCTSLSKFKKTLNGIFINAMILRADGSFEKFAMENISVLSTEGAIYVSDNEGQEGDKAMFVSVLVQNLTDEDDNYLLKSVGRRNGKEVCISELIMKEFNINLVKSESGVSIESIISNFYNKGFPVSIRGNKIDYTKLKFLSSDIEKDFLKRNIDIMPFNDIPILYRLRFLYEDPDVFFAKSVSMSEIIIAIDPSKVQNASLIQLDEFVSKVSDEKIKLEIYKKFYNIRKAYFSETVRSLSIEGVKHLIDDNDMDTVVEEKLLSALKEKLDENDFAETYLGNILIEASSTGQDYMFNYDKIISEIGRGKSDIDTINIIFRTKTFQSVGDMKAYKFVSYIIANQDNENAMLNVIEAFFSLKNSMNLEFFNIIAKQLVSEFLQKKNVLPGSIKFIEDSVHKFMEIIGKENPTSIADKFLSFFKAEDEFKILNSVRSDEEKIDKIKENGDKLIKTLLFKYQTNFDFITKYKEYFEKSFYTEIVSTLTQAKSRILILQKKLMEV